MTNWGLSQRCKVGKKCISVIHHVLKLKKINMIILIDAGKPFNKNLPTIHEGKKCVRKNKNKKKLAYLNRKHQIINK